jgi:HMGL-like/LeuA allosteric (dimerisation) domain
MTRIFLYDTTLRDGSQGEGVNFSLQDKLLITARLDEAGFDYIEGGYPLSNPKDAAYFRAVRDLELKHAKIAGFGMTRRRDIAAEDDQGMKALIEAATPVITIVGKSWDLHVHDVLGVSLEENLRMIGDSVAFCASRASEFIYDAEHFFDELKRNQDYALRTVQPGDRHVNAHDGASRKALETHYPRLKEMSLVDDKVRVNNPLAGAAARVRVLSESKDQDNTWGTVGVSENVIEANWLALVDSFEYELAKDARSGKSARSLMAESPSTKEPPKW